jgi:hypothetical protein
MDSRRDRDRDRKTGTFSDPRRDLRRDLRRGIFVLLCADPVPTSTSWITNTLRISSQPAHATVSRCSYSSITFLILIPGARGTWSDAFVSADNFWMWGYPCDTGYKIWRTVIVLHYRNTLFEITWNLYRHFFF